MAVMKTGRDVCGDKACNWKQLFLRRWKFININLVSEIIGNKSFIDYVLANTFSGG